MKKLMLVGIAWSAAIMLNGQVGNRKKDSVAIKKNIETTPVQPSVYQPYVITPSQVIHGGKGRLTAYLPKDTTITVTVLDEKIKIPVPIYSTFTLRSLSGKYDTINVPVDLAPGIYYARLNGVNINVPVEREKETRLKVGFLMITTYKKELIGATEEFEWAEGVLFEPTEETWIWTLWKPGTSGWELTGKKGKIFALLPGEYSLTKSPPFDNAQSKRYKVIIRDGKWVVNGEKQ